MFRKRHSFFGIIVLAFILAGLTSMSVPAQEETPPAEENAVKILAWIGDRVTLGQQMPANSGQLVYITGENQIDVLFDLPSGTNRVMPCSEQATSPDGQYFMFYAGAESGTLYRVRGQETPVEVASSLHGMACLGMGTFQFSPDSNRFGYIDNISNLATSTYATGWLYIKDSETLETIFSTGRDASLSDENVTAFDISNDAIAFVSLYSNAKEAAISYRTDGYPEEIATLFTDEGCTFRTFQIAIIDDNTLALIVGQRCATGSTEWAFYTVNISQRSANRTLAAGSVTGGYFATSRSNAMLISPDAKTLIFTHPDGLTQNTTNIQFIDLSNVQAGEPLFSNAIMPIFSAPNVLYSPTANAWPTLSLDGSWLAVSSNSPNNNAAINVIELGAPELPPIVINAPERNNTVSAMAFTPDSSTLLFVIGENNEAINSLFALDLVSAAETRIIRGRFGQRIVVSPDGRHAAIPAWRVPDKENEPIYQTLITLDLETRAPTNVFTGADISPEGSVSNRKFVYPLAWR